jgi:hypothetical protein
MRLSVPLYVHFFYHNEKILRQSFWENQQPNFILTFSKNRAVYDLILKNMIWVIQSTDDKKVRRMRVARWLNKATATYSE